MQLSYGAATDTGRKRNENQDSFLVDFEAESYPAHPALFVVCDGVGGAQAGKTASALAVEQIRDVFREENVADLAQRLIAAAEHASAVIFDHSQRDPSTQGMATTLVAAAFDRERCYIVNVGDSRAYRIHRGQIEKVTTDHTLIQDQIDNGLITADQAAHSPYRHVITRSLGRQSSEVGAEAYPPFALVPGETFLLCSDGLTDMVNENDISAISSAKEPSEAAQALVDLANKNGGRDNVTVVVVRVDGEFAQLASTMRLRAVEQDTVILPVEPLDEGDQTIKMPAIGGKRGPAPEEAPLDADATLRLQTIQPEQTDPPQSLKKN